MNLVELIKNQLSSGVINQLSSLIGAGEGATGSAVSAAVPALLSALSNMASSNGGAQKLLSVLSKFSSGSVENLITKMSKEPSAVQEQGSELLSSLFGGSTISGIVNVLSRFATIAPGAAQKLLGYLAPLIMGAIASKFAGKTMNAQGLANMFADEKANIASALPSGFSLSDVPGLATAGSAAVRSASRGVEAAGSSMPKWLLPLLVLAGLGLLLWWFVPSASTPAPEGQVPTVTRVQPPDIRPAVAPETVKSPVPDVTKFSTELTDTFSKLTETLTGVKDVPSAEAALPKLQDVGPKLDAVKAKLDKLSDAAKATVTALVKTSQAKLQELVDKVLAIPGVGDKLKAVVDTIMAKLTDLAR